MAPKAKHAALKAEGGASYSMMARCSNESRFCATKDYRDIGELQTPYGPVLKHMYLECVSDATPIRLAYACPFALLFIACANTAFLPFLIGALGTQLGRLVYYMDETRPGNILRPDMARAMTSIFWGIPELPDWYRSKRCFWFPLAHVPSKTMHVIKGGASAIYLKICDLFWAPVDHNFERTGIFVRGKLLKFRYGFMLVDEKAEK
jgi:hypothetical protein